MKKVSLFISVIMVMISCSLPQSSDTIKLVDQLDFSMRVNSVAFESDGTAWLATYWFEGECLIHHDTANGDQYYHSENSIINGESKIWDIDVDSRDRLWFSNHGLVCFDGQSFVRYDSSNTVMPSNKLLNIAIDSEDKVWFPSVNYIGAVREGGLGCCSDGHITMYTSQNSDIPDNDLGLVAIDESDNVWCSLMHVLYDTCLLKFDQSEWSVLDTTDFGFNPYFINGLSVNAQGELVGSIATYLSSSTIYDDLPPKFIYNGVNIEAIERDDLLGNTYFVDSDGDEWIIGNGKLTLISNSETSSVEFLCLVNFIAESPSGDIWVGHGAKVNIYRKGY